MKIPIYNEIKLKGQTGKLVDNIISNWLLGLRESNPAIIDMFKERDLLPYRDLLPWSGEFAGKYITSCYYAYKLTLNKELFDYTVKFIDELITTQDDDGYLGCYSKACRLTGAFSQAPEKSGETWDCWAHYHIMYGLLLWYDLTGNSAYFDTVIKAAELFIDKFYGDKPLITSIGWSETNLAVYHIFGLLYRRTKSEKYLLFAKEIEKDLTNEAAGDYINYSLKGYEFYECPKPRWESLHVIMGIVEMYRNTGNITYLNVAKQIFYSILKTDVHNTGGFSSDEQAIGNPFSNAIIETCCVVAYNALAIELYYETGATGILDFLERSHYNAILGANSPTGYWSTYNTPMEGARCASRHSIVFQSRAGSPDLNCCSVNAPRGVASVYDWMIAEADDMIYINFYEAFCAKLADGTVLEVSGRYPAEGSVSLSVKGNSQNKNIALRIPKWSVNTKVCYNGEVVTAVGGEYFVIGNATELNAELQLDFSPYTEKGGNGYSGKESIFVGPVLYGLDMAVNPTVDFENPPKISYNMLKAAVVGENENGGLSLDVGNMVLTDFYHLGYSGSQYKTWLEIE